MKILISPAKSINFDADITYDEHSTPAFLEQSKKLVKQLKKLSADDLGNLMSISENLSNLNHQRYQEFSTPFTTKNSRPAIFIFNGDVYDPINVQSYSKKEFEFMQDSLRILSGLYGLLKPLDLIQPYRLEMSTKFKNDAGKDLYEFWGDSITDELNNQSKKDEVIINLASNEYFKAIKPKNLNNKIIKVDFKEIKDGKPKVIGLMAKKARGEMVNYIIKNQIKDYKDIKKFKVNNYKFSPELSNDDLYIFVR